ncbi:MAG: hypothetical protein AAGA10_27650 [Bacteroidota bacterium]
MKKIILLSFLYLCLGCEENETLREEVNLRVQNLSEFDFEQVLVQAGGTENLFGDIPAGQTSFYADFNFAYRYAYVQLEIQGDTFVIQPIDFVGETPLSKGSYTYQLDVPDFENRDLQLTLRRD